MCATYMAPWYRSAHARYHSSSVVFDLRRSQTTKMTDKIFVIHDHQASNEEMNGNQASKPSGSKTRLDFEPSDSKLVIATIMWTKSTTWKAKITTALIATTNAKIFTMFFIFLEVYVVNFVFTLYVYIFFIKSQVFLQNSQNYLNIK